MRNNSISAVDSISVTVDVISVGDCVGVDVSWLYWLRCVGGF